MALVTVQRSPSVASSPQSINSDSVGQEEEENARANKSLSECYFAGKGTALVLGSNERLRPTSLYDVHRFGSTSSNSSTASSGSDIQQHLQLMFYLLRPEETLKMAVKLESARAGRTRYLVVVSRPGRNRNQLNTPVKSTIAGASATNTDYEEQSVAQQYRHSSINKLSSSIKNNQCSTCTTLTTTASTITTSTNNLNNRTNISIVSSSSASVSPLPLSSITSSSSSVTIDQLRTATTADSTIITTTGQIINNCENICDDDNDNNDDTNVNQKFCINNFKNINNINNNNCDNDLLLNHQEMKPIECFNNKLSGMCSNYCDDVINDDVMMLKNNLNINNNNNNNSYNYNNNNKNKLDNIDIDNNKQYSAYINSNGCESEESCLLGIDCNETTTVGLVLKVLADTSIRLDGDGGFSVSVCGRTHIFKPVSVQAMWSALQTLHKVSSKARENNYYSGGPSHEWVSYYEDRIESDRSCLNEWNAMDSLESRRPPSPDTIRNKPTEREETERVIRTTLKEIMMSVDLDEVTSKYIRGRLEEHLDMDLGEFKSFIDEEMLIILGQMDAPTEVFDHVYLGSEWNASNLEELQRNGVRHILNVTREIDNFFPGMFDYFNVRVYDDEKTNLLKHWDNTFKYINRAKMEGSKVLVHCKMGISRSASVVIAYAMKAYNWDFDYALKHVKEKRNCIKPNKNFISQLETYQGMLDAMKNKEKLQRSKSETNLKSTKEARLLPGSEPTPLIQALNAGIKMNERYVSGRELKKTGARPKSWSPDNVEASVLLPKQQSQSLENLGLVQKNEYETTNVRLPFSNGLNYSVSQNQAVHLQEENNNSTPVPFVKSIVNELESNEKKTKEERKSLNLNLNSGSASIEEENDNQKDTWDPGEKSTDPLNIVLTLINNDNNTNSSGIVVINKNNSQSQININTNMNSSKIKCDNNLMWTSSAQIIHQTPKVNLLISENKENTIINRDNVKKLNQQPSSRSIKDGDLFSAQLDRVFDREERKQNRLSSITSIIPPTVAELSSSDSLVSRQSSSSSVDSAVVLGYLGDNRGDTLSRHSSWGSGDTRTTPSRNSSWGSYDMRNSNSNNNNNNNINTKLQNSLIYQKINPDEIILGNSGIFPYEKDEIPWHAGTVKRTKQKIEERNAVKRICSDNKLLQNDIKGNNFDNEEPLVKKLLPQKHQQHLQQQKHYHNHHQHYHSHNPHQQQKQLRCNSEEVLSAGTSLLSTYYNRLSVSAPETSEMCFNLRCNNISNNNYNKNNQNNQNNNTNNRSKFNLKKHYSIDDTDKIKKDIELLDDCQQVLPGIVKNLKMNFEAKANTTARTNGDKKKVRSLPSSPVALHMDTTQGLLNNSCNKQVGGGVNSGINTSLTNTSGKTDNLEDINVKGLVDRYEVTKMLGNNILQQRIDQQQQSSQQPPSQQTITTLPLTKQRPRSCYYEKSSLNNYQNLSLQMPIVEGPAVNHLNNKTNDELRRPPVPPPTSQLINKINCVQTLDDVTEVSAEIPIEADTIITSSASSSPAAATAGAAVGATSSFSNNCNKNINNNLSNNNNNKNVKKVQQHGKTHPLAKLGIPKQSINTVAYNTM